MVIPANRLDHLVRVNPSLAVAIIRDLTTKLLAAENRSRKRRGRLICTSAFPRHVDKLDAFFLEHRRCGELDTGVEDGIQ